MIWVPQVRQGPFWWSFKQLYKEKFPKDGFEKVEEAQEALTKFITENPEVVGKMIRIISLEDIPKEPTVVPEVGNE